MPSVHQNSPVLSSVSTEPLMTGPQKQNKKVVENKNITQSEMLFLSVFKHFRNWITALSKRCPNELYWKSQPKKITTTNTLADKEIKHNNKLSKTICLKMNEKPVFKDVTSVTPWICSHQSEIGISCLLLDPTVLRIG